MEILNSIPTLIYYISLAVAAVVAIAICVVLVGVSGLGVRSGEWYIAGGGLAMALLVTCLAGAPLILFAGTYHLTPSSTSTFNMVFWIVYLLELLLGAASLLYLYGRKVRLIPVYLIFMLMALIGSSWTATTIELVIQVWGNSYATSGWKALVGIGGVVYTLAYFSVPLILADKAWTFFE